MTRDLRILRGGIRSLEPSIFALLIFELLFPLSLIATGRAEGPAEDSAELLRFRQEVRIVHDLGVAHVLQPADSFVDLLDHNSELCNEFSGRPPALRCAVV